jgi:hypothetical protein
MIRTEDDLRAAYDDPPGIDAAEQRIFSALGTERLPKAADRHPRRGAPLWAARRGWVAAIASGAVVLAVAATAEVIAGRGTTDRAAGPAVVRGPYRHTVVHQTQTNALPKDSVREAWTSTSGYTWGRETDDGTTFYIYNRTDPNSSQHPWSPKFLADLPTDPAAQRRYLLAHQSGHVYDQTESLFETVGSFWKGDGHPSSAALAATVQLLEHTKGITRHDVRDPLGRAAVRLDWAGYDGYVYSLLFDATTSAYLGDLVTGHGGALRSVVTVDGTTSTVPGAVASGARRAETSVDPGVPWRPPARG